LLAFIIKPEPFYSIGQFYENFEQVSDDEVRRIMKRHGMRRNTMIGLNVIWQLKKTLQDI